MCSCCGLRFPHLPYWSSHFPAHDPSSGPNSVPANLVSLPRPSSSLLGVPSNTPSQQTTPPERPRTTSPQRSPLPSLEHPRPVQLSQKSSPASVSSPFPDHKLLRSSRSTSLEFGPLSRVDSISPKFGVGVKVVLVTKLRDSLRRRETLTLPRGETADSTYKYIVGAAKRVEGEEEVPSDKELCLDDGSCKIVCVKHNAKANGKCNLASPEERPLMNQRDWTEIETLVQNYESSHTKHGKLTIVINRKLKMMSKPIRRAELPSSRRAQWNYLHWNIKQKMVKVEGGRSQRYMPNDTMQSLMREDIIQGLVSEEVNNLSVKAEEVDRITERILREAPRLLLIFVYTRIELRFLKVLLDHGLSDEVLPLPEEHPSWLPHGEDIGDFSDMNDYDMIRQSQWPFKAVVFDKAFEGHRELDPDAIVPFRSKVVRANGAFSVVYRILLEASHQRLYRLPNVPNPELALKAMHRNTAAASANERLLLKGLRDLNHDHIIKLLATYEQDGSYYFIFPLAEFSLEELMRNDPEGLDDPKSLRCKRYVAWVLGQFAGIASGLANLHERSTESDAVGSRKPPTATLLDPSVAKDKRPLGSTGYHHDIKPQNLLYFKVVADTANPCPEHGIIQIADFGIGKFHSLQSGSGTEVVRGTPTYAAPESKIPSSTPRSNDGQPKLKLSRPYDVWSLGCVLMEVLVWLVYGTGGWKEFNLARVGPVEENDPFHTDGYFDLFNNPNRGARVRESVKIWMKKLQDSPRLKDNPQGSLVGLLALIRNDVLEVDPEKRIKSNSLTDKLERLAEIARSEAGDDPLLTSSHEETESLSSSTTPAVTLEFDIPESATTPTSDSAPRKRSITQELITAGGSARPGSPVKQLHSNNSPRSSLVFRRAVAQQATSSNSSPPQRASTPPRGYFAPPSRSSTAMTGISDLSTIEPALTRLDERDEFEL